MTPCNIQKLEFESIKNRKVIADFTGGNITTDAGALQLREIEQKLKIIKKFSECFHDHRNPLKIEHSVEELVKQRVYGLVLGYEDLNDHDDLRKSHLLSLLVGKSDITGKNRKRRQDKGCPLAGKSTLNRLELSGETIDKCERYKKIRFNNDAIDEMMLDVFVKSFSKAPKKIVLDM